VFLDAKLIAGILHEVLRGCLEHTDVALFALKDLLLLARLCFEGHGPSDEAKQALRRVTELHSNAQEAEKRALQDIHVVGVR
jgi:hypothetical protein